MKLRRYSDKVAINRPRRRCQLMDELREAALYGDGSPVRGYVPREAKRPPRRRGG